MIGKKAYRIFELIYTLVVLNLLVIVTSLPIIGLVFFLEMKPRYTPFYFLGLLVSFMGLAALVACCRKLLDRDLSRPVFLFVHNIKDNYKTSFTFSFIMILIFYVINYYVYVLGSHLSFFPLIFIVSLLISFSFFIVGCIILSAFEGSGLAVLKHTCFLVLGHPLSLVKCLSINLFLFIFLYYLPIVGIVCGMTIAILCSYKLVGLELIEKTVNQTIKTQKEVY